jgi:type I restriction enzyme, S subunit
MKNDLPKGWTVEKLRQIAKVTSGATPDRKKKNYWNGEYPWITTSLINFDIIENAEEYITEDGLKNSSTKLFPIGTILIAMYGQGKTRGKVAVLGIEASTNQACGAIIPNMDKVNTSFLFQNLASRYIEIRNLSNTGNQENLNAEIIKGINLKLPPLPEQQKIAQILSTWDEAIQTTQYLLDKLESRKKGMMEELLRLQVPYWAKSKIAPCKSLTISNLQGVFLRYIFVFPGPYFINIKA